MKLIEYFFYGIARCCFWILPGRALEMGCPDENGGWYTFTNPERCVIIVPSKN